MFEFKSKDDVETLHENIQVYVPRYVENRKKDYTVLLQALETNNFRQIREYCHKIVGTARSYHFHQLEEITFLLQQYAREEDIDKIRALLPDYDNYLQSLFKQFLP